MVSSSVQDGDTTWTEWRWSGTRSDEQAFEMRGVTLFEITDDQIVAGRLYLEEIEREIASIGQPWRSFLVAGRDRRSGWRAERSPARMPRCWPCMLLVSGRGRALISASPAGYRPRRPRGRDARTRTGL